MARIIEELSVFFPTYNEEGTIRTTVENARKVLLRIAEKWEITIVNDGSSDRTGEIAGRLSEKDKRIRVIDHAPNRGYGAALITLNILGSLLPIRTGSLIFPKSPTSLRSREKPEQIWLSAIIKKEEYRSLKY